jgi:hypothetical protein
MNTNMASQWGMHRSRVGVLRAYNCFAFKWFHAATRILCSVCLFGRLGDCFGVGHCHMRRSFASVLKTEKQKKKKKKKKKEIST